MTCHSVMVVGHIGHIPMMLKIHQIPIVSYRIIVKSMNIP